MACRVLLEHGARVEHRNTLKYSPLDLVATGWVSRLDGEDGRSGESVDDRMAHYTACLVALFLSSYRFNTSLPGVYQSVVPGLLT